MSEILEKKEEASGSIIADEWAASSGRAKNRSEPVTTRRAQIANLRQEYCFAGDSACISSETLSLWTRREKPDSNPALALRILTTMPKFTIGVKPREAILAAGGALVGAAAFPPLGLWPLSFVSIILFLFLIRDRSGSEARAVALLYGVVYALSTMYWLFNIFGLSAIPLFAIMAAYYGFIATLIAMTRSQSAWLRALQIALFAVANEWLRGDAWYLRFPWYTAPHAFAAWPMMIAPVRWVGVYGFSFIIWFIAAYGVHGRRWAWAAIVLFPLCSYLLPAVPVPDRQVVLLQSEETFAIGSVIESVPAEKADLAVLPEYAYFYSPEQALNLQDGPRALAKKLNCPVVFGAVEGTYGEPRFDNVAAVIDARGELLGTFPKQRPVPLMMDGVPGTRRPVFELDQGVLGVGICYDFDAPEIAASLVRNGATVLVAPTFDAMSWSKTQHRHHELLLRLRAVENDRWILRAASSGRSEVVDPHGVPSKAGIEIGETGSTKIAFGYHHGTTPGGQMYLLGPGAAIATAVLCVLRMVAYLRRRRLCISDRE